MLFDRQRQLLTLLDALGGHKHNIDFQKLLFLFCMASDAQPAYEFVPYRFGAVSFTSYADRRKFIERGLLANNEHVWILTAEGRSCIEDSSTLKTRVLKFAKQHGHLGGDALVAETYRRFPYYATRSEIADRVLSGDAHALAAIRQNRPNPSTPGIATIGYEGKSLENYLNVLLCEGIHVLCDVRRNPISRKYGFSKNALANGCENVGIRYEHLPELGIASDMRQNLKTQSDYDTLFAKYERDSLPNQTAALQKIQNWVTHGERVALTCFEHQAQQCHRHCVADALHTRFGQIFHPIHL